MSQLDLALEAETSARHVSFVETGRAQPSRAMVLRLAEALDVPLRDQNTLLTAAGYTGVFRETSLADEEMAQVRQALGFMLRAHEPYPAYVLDRRWEVVQMNAAAEAFLSTLPVAKTSANLLRLLLHPEGLRQCLVNWESVAQAVLTRVQREHHATGTDPTRQALLDEVMAYPGMPQPGHPPGPAAPTPPLIPLIFERDGQRTSWFTTIATFGTPQDITLQELRIEFLYPADAQTALAAQ